MVQPYLMHHGILGQKWGVRRYQNEDGSLTAAGRARQDKIDKEIEKNNADLEKAHKKVSSNQSQLDDINKNGYNSETFKKVKRGYSDANGMSDKEIMSVVRNDIKSDISDGQDWVKMLEKKNSNLKSGINNRNYMDVDRSAKIRGNAIGYTGTALFSVAAIALTVGGHKVGVNTGKAAAGLLLAGTFGSVAVADATESDYKNEEYKKLGFSNAHHA